MTCSETMAGEGSSKFVSLEEEEGCFVVVEVGLKEEYRGRRHRRGENGTGLGTLTRHERVKEVKKWRTGAPTLTGTVQWSLEGVGLDLPSAGGGRIGWRKGDGDGRPLLVK